MSKRTKTWLVIAAILTVLGLVMFAGVMLGFHFDFSRLSTAEYETHTYEISEDFSDISVNMDTADIFFAISGDGVCRVVCYEQEKVKHSVAVQDGALTINVLNEREWYDYIGITEGAPRISVYLPEDEYGRLFVKASTSDIHIENMNIHALETSLTTGDVTARSIACEGDIGIHVTTGDVQLTDVVCRNLVSTGSTGDISLENVIAAEKLSIERSTGDLYFEGSDAAEIFAETDTGDVEGTLLSGKTFTVETDTGDVDVPQNAMGGKCEITTDTGDISIKTKQ